MESTLTGIAKSSWQVRILPLPKRFSRGTALGFCGGYAVGRAEAARGKTAACWWPSGQPELLAIEGQQLVQTGRASGDAIPGQWRSKTGTMGAVVWRPKGGRIAGAELHDKTYATTWATAAGGGAVVGIGSPKRKPGERPLD